MLKQQTLVDVKRYWGEGYLIMPSILSPERLAALRAESDRLLQLCSGNPNRYADRIQWERDYLDEAHQAGMQQVIRKLEPIADLSQLFAELAHESHIIDVVSAVLGGPVELFEDKLNLKLPGGSPYPWHQDWACCWRAHTDELATIFIYLDDADEINGCLKIIPGSHRDRSIYPFKPGSGFEVDPAIISQKEVVAAPLKSGEMIVFDSYLLHYSDINRSNGTRRAIIYTYNPARLGRINEQRFWPLRD